jgi:hypothetical protein
MLVACRLAGLSALAEAAKFNPKLSVAWFRAHSANFIDGPPALSRCQRKSATGLLPLKFQAAVTASRHVLIAAARKVRCVEAEVRWRWTLKMLKTAACAERNLCAEPELLKRCILRSRRRVG